MAAVPALISTSIAINKAAIVGLAEVIRYTLSLRRMRRPSPPTWPDIHIKIMAIVNAIDAVVRCPKVFSIVSFPLNRSGPCLTDIHQTANYAKVSMGRKTISISAAAATKQAGAATIPTMCSCAIMPSRNPIPSRQMPTPSTVFLTTAEVWTTTRFSTIPQKCLVNDEKKQAGFAICYYCYGSGAGFRSSAHSMTRIQVCAMIGHCGS